MTLCAINLLGMKALCMSEFNLDNTGFNLFINIVKTNESLLSHGL